MCVSVCGAKQTAKLPRMNHKFSQKVLKLQLQAKEPTNAVLPIHICMYVQYEHIRKHTHVLSVRI